MLSHLLLTLAYPGVPSSRTNLLISSLRKFGGSWAESPVWVLYPGSKGDYEAADLTRLEELGGELVPFDAEDQILQFPLATKVQAAAAAEELTDGKVDQLIWLDGDTLVLSPMDEFALDRGNILAYRPVHHKLLGTAWRKPLDRFWERIYQRCGASPERDFMMTTHLGEQIRPYFNAGCYAVKPERGILRKWERIFKSCYREPDFTAYYEKESFYAVFMHQAVFTGVVLGSLEESEIQALSPDVNYPLHLHEEIPAGLRAGRLDDLVTARYENLLNEPGWRDRFSISRQLGDWIEAQCITYFSAGEKS